MWVALAIAGLGGPKRPPVTSSTDADTDLHARAATLQFADRFRLTVYDAAYVEARAAPHATACHARRRAARRWHCAWHTPAWDVICDRGCSSESDCSSMKLMVGEMRVADRLAWIEMRSALWSDEAQEAHTKAIDELLEGGENWGLIMIAETSEGEIAGFAEVAVRKIRERL